MVAFGSVFLIFSNFGSGNENTIMLFFIHVNRVPFRSLSPLSIKPHAQSFSLNNFEGQIKRVSID